MDLEQIKSDFDKMTNDLLERVEINHISCISDIIYKNDWNKEQVQEYLNRNSYQKIEINTAFYFNDINNLKSATQEAEDKELRAVFDYAFNFLNTSVIEMCEKGENKYELNRKIRQTILKIDNYIESMNYDSWLKRKDPYNNDNIFFVLIKKERVSFRKIHIDVESRLKHLVDYNFTFRQDLLKEFKYKLGDILSEYLLLPDIKIIDLIPHKSCTATDICELILALSQSKYFGKSEKMKSLLMQMFGISPSTFTSNIHEFNQRKKNKGSRNKFLQKLSDEFR